MAQRRGDFGGDPNLDRDEEFVNKRAVFSISDRNASAQVCQHLKEMSSLKVIFQD